MLLIREIHRPLSLGKDGGRLSVMHGSGREPGNPFVFVLVVVVLKDGTTPRVGVRVAVEAVGIRGSVLGGFEERFRIRIVVADARARQRAHDPEGLIQIVQIFGDLNAAAIRVRGELITDDALARARRANEALRERRRFVARQHPRDDIATEEIEYDIQFVALAFDRTFEVGHIPRPHLIRLRGDQTRHGVRWVRALSAPRADFVRAGQPSVERPHTAHVRPFIEQRRVHLRGRTIDKAGIAQVRQHLLLCGR